MTCNEAQVVRGELICMYQLLDSDIIELLVLPRRFSPSLSALFFDCELTLWDVILQLKLVRSNHLFTMRQCGPQLSHVQVIVS